MNPISLSASSYTCPHARNTLGASAQVARASAEGVPSTATHGPLKTDASEQTRDWLARVSSQQHETSRCVAPRALSRACGTTGKLCNTCSGACSPHVPLWDPPQMQIEVGSHTILVPKGRNADGKPSGKVLESESITPRLQKTRSLETSTAASGLALWSAFVDSIRPIVEWTQGWNGSPNSYDDRNCVPETDQKSVKARQPSRRGARHHPNDGIT